MPRKPETPSTPEKKLDAVQWRLIERHGLAEVHKSIRRYRRKKCAAIGPGAPKRLNSIRYLMEWTLITAEMQALKRKGLTSDVSTACQVLADSGGLIFPFKSELLRDFPMYKDKELNKPAPNRWLVGTKATLRKHYYLGEAEFNKLQPQERQYWQNCWDT